MHLLLLHGIMKELWITNLTKMDISISDLNIIVKSMCSVNLLSRRFKLDRKEIAKSLEFGTLNKKKGLLVFGLGKPRDMSNIEVKETKTYIPDKTKSVVVSNTNEINIDDEKDKKSEEDFIIEQLGDDGE